MKNKKRYERIKDGKPLFTKSHGMTKTRQFNIWGLMLDRCNNPKSKAYKNYGGRGIKVCEKWKSFENFWNDMKDSYGDNLMIDRIDNDKGYSKENCRWSNWTEQQSNRRSNHILSFKGKSKTLTQWSRDLGIKQSTLSVRIKCGWPLEKALSSKKFVNQYG